MKTRRLLGAAAIAFLFAGIGFSCAHYNAIEKCLAAEGQWHPNGYCVGLDKVG